MFERLKNSVRVFLKIISEKELTSSELEKELKKLQLYLISNDVAYEVAKRISSKLKERLIGRRIRRFSNVYEVVKSVMKEEIEQILKSNQSIDLIEEIAKRRQMNIDDMSKNGDWRPYIVLFLGPNGAGKTLTIAKIAWMLKRKNLIPVLAASDTFRAGAIEQLEKHASALGVTLIKRAYKSDPASVAYDAIMHARAKKKDAVLIDTAGRLGTNVDLIEEMKKIARVSKPDIKVLVADALSGNDLAVQAKMFADHVGIDGNILTKVDADVKGGAALTLAYITRAPILYIGIGQKYEDLMKFDSTWFVKMILGE